MKYRLISRAAFFEGLLLTNAVIIPSLPENVKINAALPGLEPLEIWRRDDYQVATGNQVFMNHKPHYPSESTLKAWRDKESIDWDNYFYTTEEHIEQSGIRVWYPHWAEESKAKEEGFNKTGEFSWFSQKFLNDGSFRCNFKHQGCSKRYTAQEVMKRVRLDHPDIPLEQVMELARRVFFVNYFQNNFAQNVVELDRIEQKAQNHAQANAHKLVVAHTLQPNQKADAVCSMIKMAVETGIDIAVSVGSMFIPNINFGDKLSKLQQELVTLGLVNSADFAGTLVSSLPGSGSGSGVSTPGSGSSKSHLGTPDSGSSYYTPGDPGSRVSTPDSGSSYYTPGNPRSGASTSAGHSPQPGTPGSGSSYNTPETLRTPSIPSSPKIPPKSSRRNPGEYRRGMNTEIYELEPFYRYEKPPSSNEEPVGVLNFNETSGMLQERRGAESPGKFSKWIKDNGVELGVAVTHFMKSNILNGLEASKHLKEKIVGEFGTGIDGMGNNLEAGGWCARHGAGIWDQNSERLMVLTSFINFEGKVIHDGLVMIMDYVSSGQAPKLTFSSMLNGGASQGWLRDHSNRIQDVDAAVSSRVDGLVTGLWRNQKCFMEVTNDKNHTQCDGKSKSEKLGYKTCKDGFVFEIGCWTAQPSNNHMMPLHGHDQVNLTLVRDASWKNYLKVGGDNMKRGAASTNFINAIIRDEQYEPGEDFKLPVCYSPQLRIGSVDNDLMHADLAEHKRFPATCGGWRSTGTESMMESIGFHPGSASYAEFKNFGPGMPRETLSRLIPMNIDRLPPLNKFLAQCELHIHDTPKHRLHDNSTAYHEDKGMVHKLYWPHAGQDPHCAAIKNATKDMQEEEANVFFCTNSEDAKDLFANERSAVWALGTGPWGAPVITTEETRYKNMEAKCKKWMELNEKGEHFLSHNVNDPAFKKRFKGYVASY